MNPLSDTMIRDLQERGPTLCIHNKQVRIIQARCTHSTCGDGCCSFEDWDITDYLSNDDLDNRADDRIIPILELTPEWVEFLRHQPFDSCDLDLSPLID